MHLSERVKLIPRQLKSDGRGWFVKVIVGNEENLPSRTGEVYVTMALPGQVRGNHYHLQTNEWFTVIQGAAMVVVADPGTGERFESTLDGTNPVTLYVPAGVAHAFMNPEGARNPMVLVAYSDREYQPSDTRPIQLL